MGAVLTESLSTAPAPAAPGTASGGSHHRARPAIIQGGMGVAVSGWRLAREVSRTGHLGVVSGTAMDAVLARRLQDGDPGGHYRRALVHFPSPAIVERVLEKYFVDGGRAEDAPYKPIPKLTAGASRAAQELAVLGNFAEVWLAKEGHAGVVGVNCLEKVQMATPAAVFGAMLAGVDYVLMGAESRGRSRSCSRTSRLVVRPECPWTWSGRARTASRRSRRFVVCGRTWCSSTCRCPASTGSTSSSC